ncbi:MAG: phage integrase N-terminal SAM-like domain-containing protein [Deltaproteobacteria bacterium]|nr:phage integrase N-terminal SAM-like domain-containing protein [Deltaproteobacteria bacterium]
MKWILDYIRFNGTRHPREMGKPEIERFLSHLAVNRKVAPSTQNQAFMQLFFFTNMF